MAAKVLVIGATNGRFVEAFKKVASLHAKNNFSLSLLTGDLFSDPSQTPPEELVNIASLLRGDVTVPLPIYFTLGRYALPSPVREKLSHSQGEVCENLFFLGKKSVLNTSEGIRIVALGGRLDPALESSGLAEGNEDAEEAPLYTTRDAKGLKGANYADLLLTYEWPEGVSNKSAIPAAIRLPGSGAIAELATALRPRYHFAAGGEEFWEREPYRNLPGKDERVEQVKITRFLGIADWGNSGKSKMLYAFSINPHDPNVAVPPATTGLPYTSERAKGRKRPQENATGNFFWGDQISGGGGGERGQKRSRGGRDVRPKTPPGPESCFFCLSYPQLEKHLIVSIGNESYLTIAKGALASPTTTLPFSSHILIIPLTHSPTISSITDAESRTSILEEMTSYRLSIEKMLAEKSYGAVTFEVSRASGVHAHWQLVPVPSHTLPSVQAAFEEQAAADKLPPFQNADLPPEEDYFKLWISGTEAPHPPLAMPIPHGRYFDLQFGRKVLAGLLGSASVHWKDCVKTVEEETEDAAAFREAFKPFDQNL